MRLRAPGGASQVLGLHVPKLFVPQDQKEHQVKIELTEEAINCLKFWQGHEMYGGSLSDVVIRQMEEWLCRDMRSSTDREIKRELKQIKKGTF